jgi:hypothetical protein
MASIPSDMDEHSEKKVKKTQYNKSKLHENKDLGGINEE